MVTGENIGVSGALSAFTASYDTAGNLATETYPSGLAATTTYDNAGNPTSLVYAKSGSTWMSFTAQPGDGDRTVAQSSPQSSQTFAYDQDGRLTTVQDNYASACTTRVYAFDADSNRTSLTSYPAGTGGTCSTSTTPTTTTTTTSYDQADRDTNTSYAYDTLGRTTTVPSSDAKGIAGYSGVTGNLTVGYGSNDMVAAETQGSTALTFTLDPDQNRISTQSTGATTTTNHYSDDSDSPTWASTSGTVWTRNMVGPDGSLAATADQTGAVTLQLDNLHGDVVATAADTTSATAVASYSESTEYGAPRIASTANATYGWLGTAQRSNNDLAGIVLMGVRLYDPTSGRFLSVDPFFGGNSDAYTYPPNPIDGRDLTGQTSWSTFQLNNKCSKVGCVFGVADCESYENRCMVTMVWYLNAPYSTAITNVYMRFEVTVNGYGQGTQTYGHNEGGYYNWHTTFGNQAISKSDGSVVHGYGWYPQGGGKGHHLERVGTISLYAYGSCDFNGQPGWSFKIEGGWRIA